MEMARLGLWVESEQIREHSVRAACRAETVWRRAHNPLASHGSPEVASLEDLAHAKHRIP